MAGTGAGTWDKSNAPRVLACDAERVRKAWLVRGVATPPLARTALLQRRAP